MKYRKLLCLKDGFDHFWSQKQGRKTPFLLQTAGGMMSLIWIYMLKHFNIVSRQVSGSGVLNDSWKGTYFDQLLHMFSGYLFT